MAEHLATTSLRAAQQALTRNRILGAAGALLFEKGHLSCTSDEIARAAGVSRSTLYVHYPDQPMLLGAIAASYGSMLAAHVERLPSPLPSRDEIVAWVNALARLIAQEQVPATLVASLAEQADPPAVVREIGDRLIAALAWRLPSFMRALDRPTTQDLARAWAEAAMRQLGSAALLAARQGGRKAEAALTVAARVFEAFILETVTAEA